MEDAAKLDPEEDAELRRLHLLRDFGMVAGTVSSRYDALRGRDRRRAVREPDEQSIASPVEKKLWTKPARKLDTVGVSSGAERVVGDSREIFGKRPETRRGLGVFRR